MKDTKNYKMASSTARYGVFLMLTSLVRQYIRRHLPSLYYQKSIDNAKDNFLNAARKPV